MIKYDKITVYICGERWAVNMRRADWKTYSGVWLTYSYHKNWRDAYKRMWSNRIYGLDYREKKYRRNKMRNPLKVLWRKIR